MSAKNLIKWLKKLKINKEKLPILLRIFEIIILFLVPIVFYIAWFISEYEEVHIFSNLEVIGNKLTFNNRQEMMALKDSMYENTKNDFPVQFSKQKISDFDNFKSQVSERFIEELSVFSSLPIHRACLINKNEIFILGNLQENIGLSTGGAAINQKDGYNFYAERNGEDCKNISISKFRESPSRAEYAYPFTTIMSQEEGVKFQNGEKFTADIATSSVIASDTIIKIRLNYWTFVIFYFIVLPAWSVIFFQYKKISSYLKNPSN
ncbi:MAG: hypothetical protein A3A96_01730 [Candidatus Zambryskibacteria bacterium RIFCSPLOWO2_01_FULL_39_39]|uniref:Uncharacterized protein n=1 Tax=Candidatus Zambryskibacteria bacterium RIFCSPLOWO2_01_FULL_39_39 TaxID=1802758 RepID=A0A1G2TVZ5_9BACT|nr:MAG: hypothetical protein UT00_C0011G0005 [Parcubacteria group bacterium GW2011_GWA1_38_7]OHA86573.1 MAG: hypothetical protein A2644_01845 [Candidatus Zambryskibacteria bacterium RIFCSPHIGHO2_01_FULL_39_63]OHA94258.1 MAG: hypothetical protein A3B88_03870 [Candidatus Zambryskibacteria bacterium RIFCSPHIGHO2_02_FULL_39_19]OHA98475.1 MAG: hypothetical protein A3F20_03625 [Candidatus Zambryskibacteria bacterium RIFCSPHIGHO2_12_FULL_39_21]OHB01394.1 MAG: hypothetical protein A3A96_01730 [Candidat